MKRAALKLGVLVLVLGFAQSARAELELKGHGGPVKSVTIAAGGKTALTASFDYSVILWDLDARGPKLKARLEGHEAAVNIAVFVPGGRMAVSGGDDGMVGLWDLDTAKLIHRFKGHTTKVVSIAVSRDGRFAASASWDRTVRLWDLVGKRPYAIFKGHKGSVNAVAFSMDGKYLLSGGYDGTIRKWRVQDKKLEYTIKHGWGVNVLTALPGKPDRFVFGALDGAVEILNAATGQVEKKLAKHEGPVLSLAISSQHKYLATGGGDGKIFVWSLDGWGFVRQHHNPSSPVWSMAFTGDGQSIYYAGLDDFVIHWEVKPGKPFEPVKSKFPRRFQVSKNMDLGARQFARKCSICHTLTRDGGHRAGPTLFKLFGRPVGTVPGYVYSKALKGADIVWNETTIGKLFDLGPEHYTPGSKMPLQRIKSKEERKALIAFLKRATLGVEKNPKTDKR